MFHYELNCVTVFTFRWFDVFQKVLPRHLSRGKHKRNATFPCGKATIPPAGVITQDYCSEDDIRLNNYSRPKFLSSSDIMRNEKEWIESVEAEDEDVFPDHNDDSDGELKRDVEVQNALNKLMSQSEDLQDESEGITDLTLEYFSWVNFYLRVFCVL
ncbi:hypothetical protein AVEN_220307-1 [Araneus ventricosus]|uniref:Uncharacterized protein n=2 Tax=Araneus ventricosus TaxID=182803 RepID=A0A4Y2X2A8_ARAVE|nr:hypothetical protein AVEN_42021-1 [Araneus ventricosus]GBO43033.1 hypothetical protein AVEN_171234-1 [Araneus ventricosus]GBO43034.1 hypothetical protein AVEN_220307-1 [Araneus ventricosus]